MLPEYITQLFHTCENSGYVLRRSNLKLSQPNKHARKNRTKPAGLKVSILTNLTISYYRVTALHIKYLQQQFLERLDAYVSHLKLNSYSCR
jgi:hypothetical protein